MIDNFAILVSTLGVLYVIFRTAQLQRRLPWFETRSLYDQRMALEEGKAALGRKGARWAPPAAGMPPGMHAPAANVPVTPRQNIISR